MTVVGAFWINTVTAFLHGGFMKQVFLFLLMGSGGVLRKGIIDLSGRKIKAKVGSSRVMSQLSWE